MNNPSAMLPPTSNLGGKKTLGQLKATPSRYKQGGASSI